MDSQGGKREMKASPGGDKKRDLASRVSVGGDKDGEDDRKTDKLKPTKEWMNRFDEFMMYTHALLNGLLGDTRSDATSELNSRSGNSPSGNGGSCCSSQQHSCCPSPSLIQNSSQTVPEKDPKSTGSNKPPRVTDPKRRVYTSLTEAPQNLKEAIDWLIALKGTDPEKNLKAMGAAIHKFLVDKPVGYTKVPALEELKRISKRFLEHPNLKNLRTVKAMLKRYKAPMNKNPGFFYRHSGIVAESDYKNAVQARGLTAMMTAHKLGTLVYASEEFLRCIKNPDQYVSAYSPEATWDASCEQDPEACALIFVGIAPMLYAGLRSLWIAGNVSTWKWLKTIAPKKIGKLFLAFGYVRPECRPRIGTADVYLASRVMHKDILETIYDLSGFWAFY
ncbi:hypothetical protein, conserved [Babesia ovata]|uniref:Uncharacterized protein n=1 Tax=Babesia ovata TaxID=189622 RepID=A0A2H6KHJ2_9APIC|nr:uncharacterized protein BOVATA_039320 [Babesia ovata]GBE62439.1 hypothetical protein, conserved [Babesia ovata]